MGGKVSREGFFQQCRNKTSIKMLIIVHISAISFLTLSLQIHWEYNYTTNAFDTYANTYSQYLYFHINIPKCIGIIKQVFVENVFAPMLVSWAQQNI